jgi:hypothetical protein
VFREDGVFADLNGADICEDRILPAMFGRAGHIEFDTEQATPPAVRTGVAS